MLEFQKTKTFFAKWYAPNWSEVVFIVSKIKNTVSWTYVVSDLNGEETTKSFYEKELQKAIQEKSRIEKYLKEMVINCMSNGKDMIIVLIAGLIKKISYKNGSTLLEVWRKHKR